MKNILFTVAILLACSYFSRAQRVFVADSTVEDAIKVYVTTDSTLADLYVCQVDHKQKVKRDGFWHFVQNPNQADLKIWYTQDRLSAELVIYYVTIPKRVKWNKPTRRVVYNKRKNK